MAVAGSGEIAWVIGVQAKIEKVGDGFGLLLPKELLDACGFGSEAMVSVENRTLVVTPVPRRVREGWAAAARQMRERGDDLIPEPPAIAGDVCRVSA